MTKVFSHRNQKAFFYVLEGKVFPAKRRAPRANKNENAMKLLLNYFWKLLFSRLLWFIIVKRLTSSKFFFSAGTLCALAVLLWRSSGGIRQLGHAWLKLDRSLWHNSDYSLNLKGISLNRIFSFIHDVIYDRTHPYKITSDCKNWINSLLALCTKENKSK